VEPVTRATAVPPHEAAAPPPLPLALALSLVSGAALAYEILLTRLFSIIQWHHFAYMMISVALLGYGAAGTCVSLLRERLAPRTELAFAISAALFGASAAAAFLLAQRLPFNALEFLWDAQQPAWLALIYLLLFVPFFFAALCVCLMFTRFAARAGRLYSYDILGASAGCLGVVMALFAAAPLAVLGGVSVVATLAAGLAAVSGRPRYPRLALAALAIGGAAAWALTTPHAALRMSPYKELSQTLQVMGTRVVAQTSSPLGLVTVVESPQVPFRHAPGLSLSAPGEPPEQLALFTDGEGMSAIQRFDGERATLEYLDYLTSAAVYHLVEAPRTLVLGAGTGSEVLQALYHDSASIDAVELNPQVVDLVERDLGRSSGRPYAQPGVALHLGEARGFVAGTQRRYDVIQIALIDAFGASSAGMYALAESYLYTVESLRAYLSRLRPGGYLSITRWVSLPPRDTLKLFGMAARALEQQGVREPGRRMALLRGWKTATLLVKAGDLTPEDIARLRRFCRERSFDLDWYPGMPADEANRYNQLDQPWFHEGAVALLGPQREAYIERYKFNIAPATDDRPYFFHFFRWRTLPELLRLKEQGGLPLLEWGYPLVVATLAQALVASVALILLPLWWLRRQARDARAGLAWWRVAGYFATIGVAFMFVEIAFIQKFTLFLAHPLYAVAVVLFAFLLSAGLGSRASETLLPRGQSRRNALLWPVGAIVALSLMYAALLPQLLPLFAGWPDAGRIALAVALIFPLGFAMGMPFPTGIAAIASAPGPLVPWAWGVNACASVVSAVLATLLAIHIGFTAVTLIAVALYATAALWFSAMRCTRLRG
jgi:hypothetical protein